MKKISIHRPVRYLSTAICLLIGSLACSSVPFLSPTPTPTATSTSTPTETPTRTNTPKPTKTATSTMTLAPAQLPFPSDWQKLFSDSFDSNQNGWDEGLTAGNWGSINSSFENGKYISTLQTSGEGSRLPIHQTSLTNIKNFFFAVDVEQTEGGEDGYFGISFRETSKVGYVFVIQLNSRQYNLGYSDSEQWVVISDWTVSSSINTNKPNRLAVLMQDTTITLFINGKQVEKLTDSHDTASGGVGLTIASFNPRSKVTVAFDNLEVYAP